MHVLITGGAGYLGSRLVRHFMEQHRDVTVLDNLSRGGTSLLPYLDDCRFRFIRGDVRDEGVVAKAMRDVDTVVHLAAVAVYDEKRLDEAYGVNVVGTQLVVKAAKAASIIYASTCSVYGRTDDEATEETAPNPLSPYARTKLEAEQSVLDAGGCVLRMGTLMGLSANMRWDLLVNQLARDIAAGTVFILRDRMAWRPFLHLQDAIGVYDLFVRYPDWVGNQVFNVASQNMVKHNLIRIACDSTGKHEHDGWIAPRLGGVDKRDYRVSIQKAFDLLSWQPTHTVKEAFSQIADAVRRELV